MDIEFGKLQQSKPSTGLRPDQDGQLLVATIGRPHPNDLPVFVDLDVMRDMEAHAISNTRVELGGVMLGYQRVDRYGKPFVVITDCLRAEHYQATRGSFKFTHETWSQITRDRAKFKPELEMVGWYHTHPGFSVFLSGMDLFICDNFFNRPLDVALVIDPCHDDRGWFYWSDSKGSADAVDPLEDAHADQIEILAETDTQTKSEAVSESDAVSSPVKSGGFYLTTGRFREDELLYFSNHYNRLPNMNRDPRYSNQPAGGSQPGTGQTMLQLTDQRKPLFEIALASMVLVQFCLMALIAWRLTVAVSPPAADQSEVVVLQERLAGMEGAQRSQIERQAYQEVLQMIVDAREGQPDFVQRYAEVKSELDQANSNLIAQISLSEQLKQTQLASARELDEKNKLNERLSNQLQSALQELRETRSRTEALLTQFKKDGIDPATSRESTLALKKFELPWWGAIVSGLAVLVVGAGGGFLFGKSRTSLVPGEYEEPNSPRG